MVTIGDCKVDLTIRDETLSSASASCLRTGVCWPGAALPELDGNLTGEPTTRHSFSSASPLEGFALGNGVGSWSVARGSLGEVCFVSVRNTFVTEPNAANPLRVGDVGCCILLTFSASLDAPWIGAKSSLRALTLDFPSALASLSTHSCSRALFLAGHRMPGDEGFPHTLLHQSSTSLFGRSLPTDSRAMRWKSSTFTPWVQGRSLVR